MAADKAARPNVYARQYAHLTLMPSGPLTSVRRQPRKRRLRVWRPTLGASTTVPAVVNGHIDQWRA